MTILHLAYGSNLHPLRLTARVPSARLLGTLALPGWALCFHKRGRDGSGKCSIHRSDAPGERVYAALYELARRDKPALDAAEGPGYGETGLRLKFEGASVEAYVYIAREDFIDAGLRPYSWYRELVVAGARYHGFPPDYLARLTAVASVADPDTARRAGHEALLAAIRGG